MSKKRALTLAATLVAAVLLVGYGFLVGSASHDPEPVPEEPLTAYEPDEPTYTEQLAECVQEHQSLYDASIDLSRGICANYLNEKGVAR